MKANKIIEMSQEKSRQKVKLAMDEIQRMRNEGERITVSGLCKRTGLSNSFFYRNPKIKEEVHKAVDIQNQSYKMNIDEVELLDEYKEKLLAMRIEIIKLKAENQKLKSELDFSKLKSLLIICYDRQYTEFLKEIFKDDPICEKIVNDDSVCEALFERENRSVCLKEQGDSSTLSSDFMDEHYFRISSDSLSSIGFDISSAHVVKDNGKELILTGTIKWAKTEKPFNVYFIDPNARTKEWLIYSNNYMPTEDSTKYKLEESVRNAIDSFVKTLNNMPIKLTKDLFYPHMVNSYHGIAHTTRVLLATHLLCKAIKLQDDETIACYIAAIIHDLGKSYDKESAEHGYKSMLLYIE